MLQLANLRSAGQTSPSLVELDLAAVIQASLARFEAAAAQRNIRIQSDLQPCIDCGRRRPLEDADGQPAQQCHQLLERRREGPRFCRGQSHGDGASGCLATMGSASPRTNCRASSTTTIAPAKPHTITRQSTGLGLAIVRHVARSAGIQVQVESRHGRGHSLHIDDSAAAATFRRRGSDSSWQSRWGRIHSYIIHIPGRAINIESSLSTAGDQIHGLCVDCG